MNLYFFNFSHELAMANGHKNYLAPDVVRTMERDLMPLSAFCASQGDGVVVDESLLEVCRRFYGTLCPEVQFYSLGQLPPLFRLQPWGWDERLLWTFQKAGASILSKNSSVLQSVDAEKNTTSFESPEKRSEEIQKTSEEIQKDTDVFFTSSEVVSKGGRSACVNSGAHREQCLSKSTVRDMAFSNVDRQSLCSSYSKNVLAHVSEESVAERASALYNIHARLSEVRRLASRETSSVLLNRLIHRLPGLPLCGESAYCTTIDSVTEVVARLPRAIIKAPWSSSGRGLRFAQGRIDGPLSGWCRHVIQTQGGVVVEPFYDKLLDFAAEFEAECSGRVRFVAFSKFETTDRCSYAGNAVASQVLLLQDIFGHYEEEIFNLMVPHLQSLLSEEVKGRYVGPLGVDMMLCHVNNERFPRLHPCVEINVRRTMGLLATNLARFVPYGSEAQFFIHFEHQPEQLRCFADAEPVPTFDGCGRLIKGTMLLTPVLPSTKYAAFLKMKG